MIEQAMYKRDGGVNSQTSLYIFNYERLGDNTGMH